MRLRIAKALPIFVPAVMLPGMAAFPCPGSRRISYRSGKPLIVTTNLTLDDLHNPEDTAHSRIYDRLLSMCVPVRFTGDNFRQEAAQRKMESMKKLITD